MNAKHYGMKFEFKFGKRNFFNIHSNFTSIERNMSYVTEIYYFVRNVFKYVK